MNESNLCFCAFLCWLHRTQIVQTCNTTHQLAWCSFNLWGKVWLGKITGNWSKKGEQQEYENIWPYIVHLQFWGLIDTRIATYFYSSHMFMQKSLASFLLSYSTTRPWDQEQFYLFQSELLLLLALFLISSLFQHKQKLSSWTEISPR